MNDILKSLLTQPGHGVPSWASGDASPNVMTSDRPTSLWANNDKRELTVRIAGPVGTPERGQLVTLSLVPSDVSEPAEMSTYLAGYKPFPFRADEVSPPVLVDKDEDRFRDFNIDDAFRRVDVKGSREGAIPEIDVKSSLTNYVVVDRFLGAFINDITEQNAAADGAPFRPRQRSMRRVGWALQLDRELDLWGLLDTGGSWTAANTVTLGAAFAWNGGASADPIFDIHGRVEASAQMVTGTWFNQQVANTFLRNPSVRDHMRQMIGDNAADSALGQVQNAATQQVDFRIPGLPPFHVAAAKVKNETTLALDYILPDSVIMNTVPPGGIPLDGEETATTYTFRRRGVAGVGFETREFRIENRGPKGGTMVVASMADIAVITGSNVGGRIADVIQ